MNFRSIDDAREVLCAGPYSIANRPMILKQWTTDFDFTTEFPAEIPLWVKFPKLPMSCWGVRSLSRIVYWGNPFLLMSVRPNSPEFLTPVCS